MYRGTLRIREVPGAAVGWVAEDAVAAGVVDRDDVAGTAVVADGAATVVAVEACTLLALDIVDFHGLLGRHPELARIIREEADQRLADTTPLRRAEAALAIDESA